MEVRYEMTVEQMRAKIAKVYKSMSWATKVNMMSDIQVIAVYHRLLKQGRML